MKVYDQRYFDDDGSLTGIWDFLGQVGAAGVQLLPSLFGSGGGGSGGQAKGLQAITAFGQQAIQTLQQIMQGLQSGQLSPGDAVSNAERISSALSDPQYVYQAQRGKDAEALAGFKQQASQMVEQIKAAASTVATATNPNAAGNNASPNATNNKGIDTSTMLLLGGGLLALLLLTR